MIKNTTVGSAHRISLLVCTLVLGLIFSEASAATYYSRNTGAWGTLGNWSLTGHTVTNAPSVLPGAGDIVMIGDGDVITIASGSTISVASIIIGDAGAGTLTFGNGTVATTLAVSGNITVNTAPNAGIFQSGATGGIVHNINIGGDLTNNGTVNLTAGNAVRMIFNGNATRTITGSGTFSFRNISLLTTAANNVVVDANISISGELNFANDGLLIVNADDNITLAAAATFLNNGTARYIQLDGSSGANSQLIRITASNLNDWKKVYPIGTLVGGYSPLDLTASTLVGNPTANSTLAVKAIANSSIQGQLRRVFRLIVNGNANAASTFINAKFNYNNPGDVSSGDNIANYNTIWYLNASTGSTGSWVTTVGGTAPGSGFFTAPTTAQSLSTGTYYYTIGTSTAYPNTWYSYQSGNWSTASNWTLDPSGTTLVNPLNLPPLPGDEIVILNGITITNDVSGQVASNTTIQAGASLDMATTTGNTLGTVTGAGLLRMNGTNLPGGTYTAFVTAITGGTIEYYNTGGVIPPISTTPAAVYTYNNLLLTNNTSANAVFVSANTTSLTINGDLNIIRTGGSNLVTWQINDNTAAARTLVVNGNINVSEGGQILAGTGNHASTTQHSLTFYGNLTNNGTVRLLNPGNVATFTTTAALFGDAVNVTFSGIANQKVTCNGVTDFYRFIVSKGTGQQAILTVNSADDGYFKLYGPLNRASSGADPNRISNGALSLVNGTLELTGKITIPLLLVASTNALLIDIYPIPRGSALWLNSPDVSLTITDNATTNNEQRLQVDGLLKVSNGTLNSGYSRGLCSGSGGTFIVENGTVNIWQFRPVATGTNVFVYIQSGGTVNIGTTGYNGTPVLTGVTDTYGNAYGRFSLPSATSTFQMTGGTLNIGKPTNTGAVEIASSSANYNVTGGTINAYIASTGTNNFIFDTTAPLYDVNIYREGGALNANTTLPLTVINNLVLISGATTATRPVLLCNNQPLSIGGDFDIQNQCTFTPGTATVTFNRSAAQNWINNGNINPSTTPTGSYSAIVMNKSAGILTLSGSGTFNMTSLTLTSGTLEDGGETVNVTNGAGAAVLINNAKHTSTGSGAIVTSAGVATIGGNNGIFGNLTIQTAGTVTTGGDQTITGDLRLTSTTSVLNILSNNLNVNGGIYTNATTGVAFSATAQRILTNGLRNDGGLTRSASDAIDLLFPVGTASAAYTPATINVDVNNTGGTTGAITLRPVTGTHPNVTTANQSVAYYWRVTSTGFSNILAVKHINYTYSTTPAKNGASGANYRAARYDASTLSWGYDNTVYNATTTPGTTTIAPGALPYTFNTASAWTGVTGTKLDGEYTAGIATAFGTVNVFYSKNATGNWNTPSDWSNDVARSSTASSVPCATCPVVISNNNTMNVAANTTVCGSLQIASGSTLDCKAFTALNFGANTGETVSGTGTLRIDISSGQFPSGDFSKFVDVNGGTVEWYGPGNTTAYTIPSTGILASGTYNNLIITPNTNQTISLPALNLTVYGTLTKNGAGTMATNTGATRTININGDFMINTGTVAPQSAVITNFIVAGNTTISNGASFSLPAGGTTNHTFTTSGNITNNGTVRFLNGSRMNITFTGTSNTNFDGTGSGGTILNGITVNKGTSQNATVTLSVGGTITSLATNWLNLQNGTFNFNSPSASFILENSNATYSIPSTARLKVQSGTVDIIPSTVNSDAADLLLSGTLEVAGGTVNICPLSAARDRNNDIEYASAGTPTILVSGGQLYINGGVRRSTATLAGALVYNQSGGTVTVGGRNCSANSSRGVFEIENNTGSDFKLTGSGVLTVSRSTNTAPTVPAYADLYLNPVTSSVSSGATIQLGMNTNTSVSGTLYANIVPSIGNLTLLNGTTAQNIILRSSDLSTTGTLTLNANTTLTTNALNVNVGGDFIIATGSTYAGISSTTTFNGNTAQAASLIGSATFLNITVNKASASTLSLTGSSPTVTNLNLLNGGFDVGLGLTLSVTGDIINYGMQTGDGIITMAGANLTHSITSLNGAFTNLSLGGTSTTKRITVSGDLMINGTLNFTTSGTSRYLFIQSSKLTFGANGKTSNEGVTRFIRTNGVSSDAGVVKDWPVGTTTFTYAVGTRTNYTPVIFTSLNVTTAGSMRVTPVDNQHPTASATGPLILNYYWIVNHDNTLAYGINTGASHAYQFPNGLLGGFGGTLFGAYLNAVNLDGWNSAGVLNSPTNTSLTFTNALNTNLPLANGTFHYTVGTSATLPNPVTPVYSRFSEADGSFPSIVNNLLSGATWNSLSSWTLSSDGRGAPVLQIPVGRPVVILPNSRINMDLAGLRSFSTKIDGLLVTNTAGHDLGTISGTGTLRTSTSTLPAGTYTAFVSAGGGTIEYIAPMTMNARGVYNNLSIYPSSTGTVTMTNTDLVINGNLSIPTGATLDNSVNNRDITIAGNWTSTGTAVFNAGTGTVTLNGGVGQNMSPSAFNNLNISNPADVTLTGSIIVNGALTMNNGDLITSGGSVTVNGSLNMNNGNIITSATNKLVMGSSATITGGSTSSFVAGPMRKVMAAGTSFNFPVGNVTPLRYRPVVLGATSIAENWEVQYVSKNPLLDGYAPTDLNTATIAKVSEFEYWNISRVTPASIAAASVTLSYGAGSYIGSDIGNMADLKVVHWNSPKWDVPYGGATFSQSGSVTAGTVTASIVTTFSPFTLGSTQSSSPLPITLVSFTAERLDNSVLLNWETVQEINNDRFEVERSSDGRTFKKIATVQGGGNSSSIKKYVLTDKEFVSGVLYYRLKQVDFDEKSSYSKVVKVEAGAGLQSVWVAYPNPVESNNSIQINKPDVDDNTSINLLLHSSDGKILMKESGTLKEINAKLSNQTSSYTSGVYILQVFDNDSHQFIKVIRH